MHLCLRVACLALLLACGGGESGGEAVSAPAPAAATPTTDAEGRLDPAPYRAQIEATELLLYLPEGLSEDGWKALSKALLELHNEIVFRDESASARETSTRLFFLSARADATAGNDHDDAELAELREQWRVLSAEKFARAEWIRAQIVAR